MSAIKDIEARLARQIGLNATSVGVASIRLSVNARMKARGIKETAAYAALLTESDAEQQRLIEAVVVPETWFFRDQQPFIALADWVVKRWLPDHPKGVLRVLSMPCSTGEEPYSVVMALLDAGVPASRFAVEAVDISNPSLQRARRACYGRNAFRGRSIGFRTHYFTEIEAGVWQLKDSVRTQVQFRQANLLDPTFLSSTSAKDVIFCRNLLIYLDHESQQQVMKTIATLLSPGGMIFAGHAEAYLYSRAGFQSSSYPMAFAFQRRTPAKPAPESPLIPKAAPIRKPRRIEDPPPPKKTEAAPPPRVATAPAPSPKEPSPRKEALPTASADAALDECQRLADSGQLEAAILKAKACLELHGPSARTYYLLALATDASGKKEEAAQLYRKTLYLEPDHSEAMAQLAFISKDKGDERTARQLQERLRRLEIRQSGTGTP